ncbi:MAG: ABC transporter ATP-binding protein [Candidatus Hodarchaeota archaeon]
MAFFEVQSVFFKYEDQWILEDISFQVEKGELIAIVGPSGCGKTTLLRIFVGILNPQKGAVIIENKDILNQRIETRNIGYVPQNQGLFPHLTVYDNIAFGLKAQKWEKSDIELRVKELSQMGGLEKMVLRKPHELSGGQQQRVALMRALAPSPKLLLLDEPLSNIDTQLREQLAVYIRNIQKMAGITTLFVTHDLNEAKMLADKLIVINKGKIVQIGSSKDISLKPESIEVAKTLGLKNLYEVQSIKGDRDDKNIIIETEIGMLTIPKEIVKENWNEAKGVYIDPASIKISNEKIQGPNNFQGEIIANIPEPMIHQSTLLIKVKVSNNKNNKRRYTKQKDLSIILRIQIPIAESDYKILEKIWVRIPPRSIRIYE